MIEISILLIFFSKGFGEFSLDKTLFLKAVLPFLILACHYCPCIIPIKNNISFLGYYAVSIFFFISGYGLSSKLYQRGGEAISTKYLINKLLILIIPLISTTLLYVLISHEFNIKINLNIIESLGRGEFINPISWFVIKLIILYVFMYISSKSDHFLIILLFLIVSFMLFEKLIGIQSTYYISDLSFFAGCIYKKINAYQWNIWVRRILYMLLIILMLVFPKGLMPLICFCLPIFFISLISSINLPKNELITHLGNISYELYLVQISAAIIIKHYFIADSLFKELFAFVLICLLSILIASLIKPLDTLLCNKLIYGKRIK